MSDFDAEKWLRTFIGGENAEKVADELAAAKQDRDFWKNAHKVDLAAAKARVEAEQAISRKLYEAAKNLRDVKGRHHSEIAMNRLIEAIAEYEKERK